MASPSNRSNSLNSSRMWLTLIEPCIGLVTRRALSRWMNRPSRVAQFVERVPMVEGRLERKASTATAYAWLVWEKGRLGSCELVWIPPCRKKLERDKDYDLPPIMW